VAPIQDRSLQDQFRQVTEFARDVIGLFDVHGNRLYVNKPGLDFFGTPEEIEQGADPFKHVHPEDRERIRTRFAEVVRTGEPGRFEVRALTRDGKVRVMESEATPVRDSSGRVIAVLGVARDVTENRRDEAALKATLATLFEQAPIGIAITDLEGHFLTINQRMKRILGYTEEDVSKRNIWEIVHSADRARIDGLWADLIGGRIDHFTAEKRIVRSDGEVRWVACNAALVRPPLGGPSFTIELADDITERKRVDEALREREELLEAIFEHAPIGIAITDMDARFLRVNPRYQRMLGYTEEELYRLTGWDVTYADDAETNRKLRDELFAGKLEDFSWEKRYIRKNGEVLWAQNTVTLIRDAGGAPRYAMALVEEITMRRLADAAIHATAGKLQALTRRLVELQETERRDIARELHDRVGQTLTAMRINMDMIRTHLAEHDDALIRQRNDDSLELIESAFKSVENVMYELRPPMIDETGLIAPLQWYAKKFAARTGIEVEVRGDESRRFRPDAELALFRIAQEALNNVARHALARRVALELHETGPHVVLTIEDDGVGFDRENEQAEKAGYGFITMRERAEAVGGEFEACSAKGKGTRITVKVPRKP
jgi:PAS domain S-box-containing protein